MRKSEYPKVVKTLGQRIRKKRMDLGFTLAEVAKASDISEGYLSKIEADKQVPDMEVAILLAKKLNDDVYIYLWISLSKRSEKTSHLSETKRYSFFKEGDYATTEHPSWLMVKEISVKMRDLINKLPLSPEKQKLADLTTKLINLVEEKTVSPEDLRTLVHVLF